MPRESSAFPAREPSKKASVRNKRRRKQTNRIFLSCVLMFIEKLRNVVFATIFEKTGKYAYSRLLEKRVIQLMQKMNGKSEVTYEKSGIIF
jgi:hypothetical protein